MAFPTCKISNNVVKLAGKDSRCTLSSILNLAASETGNLVHQGTATEIRHHISDHILQIDFLVNTLKNGEYVTRLAREIAPLKLIVKRSF